MVTRTLSDKRLPLLPALLFFLIGVAPAPAMAALNFSGCEVLEIVIADTQNAHVRLSCTPSNLPPCAGNNPWVAFDKSTPEGKQYLALLTMAYATNAKVAGVIAPSCPAFQSNVAWLIHLRVTR